MFSRMCKVVSFLVFLTSIAQFAYAQEITKEIEFKTDDGWTISGTLKLPSGASKDNQYPAVITLHQLEHDRQDFELEEGFGGRLPREFGIAVLAIDWRGREKSTGIHQPVPDSLHDLSPKMQKQLYLDVKGAIEFLAAYPGVDRSRIAIAAAEFSGEHAVRAMQDTLVPIRALMLLSATDLSQESKDFLASIETPIFTGASILHRPVFMDMAEVYGNSKNPDSMMIAPAASEQGYNLFHAEFLRGDAEHGASSLDDAMIWLTQQVKNLGTSRAVSLKTDDGWTIYGNYRQPDDMGKDGRLKPGIIMVPGARSNRYSMYRFEEELARRGYAVLAIEMRGRGASMQGGTIEDNAEVRAVHENLLGSPFELDTMAAIDYITSQKGIDPNRIGIVGEARGTRSALLASAGDDRIKAMALLSVYEPDEKMEQVISQMDIPILLIDAETNWAAGGTNHVHRLAKRSQIMIYPGLGHSHHIRYFHPEVVGFIADFMERELPPVVQE